MNIWDDEWGAQGEDWSGGGALAKPLPRGQGLGATLYELDPGDFVVYHFHHSWEELLVVLQGRPTLRTPEGERTLEEGEVAHFPTGPAGAHALRNETGERVRYLMASTLQMPEVCEYPDLKKITAQSFSGSMTGEELWLIHDVDELTNEGWAALVARPGERPHAGGRRARPSPIGRFGSGMKSGGGGI